MDENISDSRLEGKLSLKEKAKKEVVEEEDVEEEEDEKKKRVVMLGAVASRKVSGGGSVSPPCCQAEKCMADLTNAKRYHRRHKVCEHHSKAPVVIVAGLQQRFCQQCSRFHEIFVFDNAKRSCRRRLAGHNERRRKNSSESHAEGSSRKGVEPQLKENHCRQTEKDGRMQITLTGNATCKHFQIV